ncbi:MAG: LacI family transcriptional regulator [Verrucomicrobia bacterium]|nr:LacI family transcriptional regulator [Verrucomicrobiota bacterium]
MAQPRPVTMADLARIAGVSSTTVSLSLSLSPKIPEETRARILAIARQHGYHPNPYVSALMRCRRKRLALEHPVALALINGLGHSDAWRASSSATRRQVREGALERARELGYQVYEYWLHQDGMSPQRFSEMLRARGVQGLLMGPMPDEEPPPPLNWEYFSAVGINVTYKPLPLHVVCSDHHHAITRIVHECHALGYRRPALVIVRSQRHYFQGLVESGYLSAVDALVGVKRIAPLYVESIEDRTRFDESAFRQWLKRRRADVLITPDAEFLERILRDLGLQVPSDIGLASLGCAAIGDRFSGICQLGHKKGAAAMDVLAGLVERNETGLPEHPITTLIEGRWNPGRTLRPAVVVSTAAR